MKAPPHFIEYLLTEREAARILAVSSAWLQRKRWEGGGPAWIEHGRAVRYEPSAIRGWIDEHRVDPSLQLSRSKATSL